MRPIPLRARSYFFIAILSACFAACGLFEYSPYELPPPDPTYGDGARALTALNLDRIAGQPKQAGRSFSFAVMADSHTDYDGLAAAVTKINSDSAIDFVFMAGDMTKFGLLKEYEWFKRAISGLNRPYMTIIGNHDALANGTGIYRRMFGELDYAFTFQGVRFICANTNIWEFDYKAPNWSWLEGELAGAADSLRLFVVSHIGPFGDQFDDAAEDTWKSLMVRYGVEYSIHGHQHNYRHQETYGDGVEYLVADNVGDRNYVKLTVGDTGVAVERVWF